LSDGFAACRFSRLHYLPQLPTIESAEEEAEKKEEEAMMLEMIPSVCLMSL